MPGDNPRPNLPRPRLVDAEARGEDGQKFVGILDRVRRRAVCSAFGKHASTQRDMPAGKALLGDEIEHEVRIRVGRDEATLGREQGVLCRSEAEIEAVRRAPGGFGESPIAVVGFFKGDREGYLVPLAGRER